MPPHILAPMMLTLGAWLHTLHPFLVRFSDDFGIRWYGLAYLAGFAAAYLLLRWMAGRGLTPIPRERVGDALMWFIGGVLVGGRLGYVLIYQPSLLWEVEPGFPWWGVLAINHGGMASHGGMVGVIVATVRVSRGWSDQDGVRHGACPPMHVMDVVAMLGPTGIFLGRVANFVNGELLGKPVSRPGVEGPWWSVQFPQELSGWVDRGIRSKGSHAPALDEEQQRQLFALVEKTRHINDTSSGAIDRLIGNAGQYAGQLKPLLSSRHPSQLYQAAAEGIVVGLVVWGVAARARKPGVVGCWFLISYGVLRILTEFVRLPDPQFGESGRIFGLSRGQWLSAGMVAAGVGILAWAARRPAQKMGGWCAGAPRS